jgi:hypothetical protein
MSEQECTHEKLVDGYYGHDCADCGVLIYPYGSEPWSPTDDADDDPHGAWLDAWLERCGGLTQASVCVLAGTEECDFECPFRTKFDGPRKEQHAHAER